MKRKSLIIPTLQRKTNKLEITPIKHQKADTPFVKMEWPYEAYEMPTISDLGKNKNKVLL